MEDLTLRTSRLLALAAAMLSAPLLAGCGSSRTYESDPHALLREAKQAVDQTPALHFVISSDNTAVGSGIFITGGEGDARRPDGFSGSIRVSASGLPLQIRILSSGGTFYVSVLGGPFTPADPAKYGFEDPAKLIDPNAGLSTLLEAATSAALRDRDRLPGSGTELYEVEVQLDGNKVKLLLPDADPSRPVTGTVGIDVDNHQVRRVVLEGPLLARDKVSTFTLLLDKYGENVTITAPPHGGG